MGLDISAVDIIALCDVDGDLAITSTDALAILRYSVGALINTRIGTPVG